MKNLISTLLLCILAHFAYSQEFEYLSILPEIQVGTNVIETNEGDFIISVNKSVHFDSAYHHRLVKLNHLGEYTQEAILKNDTFHLFMSVAIKEDLGFVIIGQGTNLYTNQKFLWFGQFDNNLALIQSKKHPFDLDYALLTAKKNENGNFIIAGSRVHNTIGLPILPYVIELDNQGNLIQSKMNFPTIGLKAISDILIRRDSSGYLLFGDDFIILDSALNVIYNQDNMPFTLRTQGHINYFNDSIYIFSGKQNFDISTLTSVRDIGIGITDLQFNELHHDFFGLYDTTDFPAPLQSVSVTGNTIYCGGMANMNLYQYPVSDYSSHFVLAQYDSVLNRQWLKYYGGDAYYIMYSLLATADGGCIMVGYRYDFNTNNKLDLYVLKVDANGNAITSTAIPLENELIANIYPNPFVDYFKLETEANKTLNFRLFSTSGQLIREAKFYNNLEMNDLSNLSQGVYFYTIMDSNQVLKSGKVLKR